MPPSGRKQRLAAETLMKSAQDRFDGLSIRLFDDYLRKWAILTWTKGEKYPLPEGQLEILYDIARRYGDPNGRTGAQIPRRPDQDQSLPGLRQADHYLNSEEFFSETFSGTARVY